MPRTQIRAKNIRPAEFTLGAGVAILVLMLVRCVTRFVKRANRRMRPREIDGRWTVLGV